MVSWVVERHGRTEVVSMEGYGRPKVKLKEVLGEVASCLKLRKDSLAMEGCRLLKADSRKDLGEAAS